MVLGSIINILYISIIDFILLIFIIKSLEKFENKNLIDIAEYVGKSLLKNTISVITILLLFLGAFITLVDFINIIKTIYYSNFSIIYILYFFIFAILISNLNGLKSISRSASFIIIFSIGSVLITFFANISNIKINSVTPILGESLYKTFIQGTSNVFAIYIIIYMYFLKPLLSNPNNYKKVALKSFIYSVIIILLTIIPLLTLFNQELNVEPINSLLLLVKQIELGSFIQRIDALFILLWIFTIFSYLSFVIYLINSILKNMTNIKDEKMYTFSSCSILLGLTLIPINIASLHYLENVIYRYFIIIYMFIISPIILVCGNLKKGKI